MAADRTIILLRVTMEAVSPLAIASGEEDALNDTMLARDPNGLPTLPATSIAGALRAAALGQNPDAAHRRLVDDWFGYQDGDKGGRSAVTFTDGLFHWADNHPRDGLILDPANGPENDALSRHFLPDADGILTRDHVRLNDRGVAEDAGKFTRAAVPGGARFTFHMQTGNAELADRLEALIRAGLWLGGASRSGYGELRCVAFGKEAVTLPEGWAKWISIAKADMGRGHPVPMQAVSTSGATATWTLSGRTEGPLLIGAAARDSKTEDRSPWREVRIDWTGNQGKLGQAVWVIPGSAIKGPIRHRTLFYLHKAKIAGESIDPEAVLSDLFGTATGSDGATAGKLRFHDCRLGPETPVFHQTHVGLDRFTGGARRGVLFTDEMLWQPQLTIAITELRSLSDAQHKALKAALVDLQQGLCGIGADWGEGAGILAPGSSLDEPDATSASDGTSERATDAA